MPQPIVYVEFGATDVPRAAAFYQYVFGWEFSDPGAVKYSTFSSGPNGIGGGIYVIDKANGNGNSGVVLYIMVDDIDNYSGKIIAGGGQVVVPKSEIKEVGWYGHFKDPSGNLLGLFTPGS